MSRISKKLDKRATEILIKSTCANPEDFTCEAGHWVMWVPSGSWDMVEYDEMSPFSWLCMLVNDACFKYETFDDGSEFGYQVVRKEIAKFDGSPLRAFRLFKRFYMEPQQ